MSDDLMIQGVNPQIQRVSTTSYLLGGTALGAAAGYGGTLLKKGGEAKSYEELIQKANEADKVELTAKKEAVDKAEKALAEAGKAVYEGTEKDALDKAIQARDAKLAELTETKETSKVFKPQTWDKLKFDSAELPRTNERTGKPFTTNKGATTWENQVKAEYNRLLAEYNRALSDLNSRIGAGDEQKLNNYKSQIQNYLDATNRAHSGTKPSKIERLFTTETGWGKHTSEYKRAEGVARSIMPQVSKDPARLTNEQLLSFAERLEKGATVPSGYRTKTVFEVVDGKRKPVKLAFNSEMFNEFRTSENAKIIERQNELIESLLSRAKENISLQKQKAGFINNFVETIPDATAEKTGMFNVRSGRKEVKIADIIREASSKPNFYDSDLSKVTKAIEKNGGAHTTLPTGLRGSYSGAADLQKLQEMIQTRKEVLKMYNQEERALNKEIKACLDDHAVLKELDDKIATVRNNDEALAKAKEAIFKQFPGLAEGTERVGLTTEQAMEKDAYKNLAKIVEDKQAAYDKVLAEKGKVNEGAKKAAEETVAKAKGELDKLVSDLGGKVGGMSGKMKAAIIGGTAVVGALIGTGMASSKNKKIEEAAQNIYA